MQKFLHLYTKQYNIVAWGCPRKETVYLSSSNRGDLIMKENWKIKTSWKKIYPGENASFYNPAVGERLFWIGFILYLGINVWSTTMFPKCGVISKICKLIFLACMGAKTLLYSQYSLKEWLLIFLSGGCVLGNLYETHYQEPLMWLVLIVSSQNISFRKILKVYVLVTGGICVLAFAASMMGIIENLQYETWNRGIRNSFGIIYPTDCAAHVFFLMVSLFYLLGERIRVIHCAAGIVVGFLVYHFCKARVDSACMIITAVLFWIGNLLEKEENEGKRYFGIWRKLWETLGAFVMPALAALSIALTAAYQFGSEFWEHCDGTLLARLQFGKRAFTEYGIKVFGQNIKMVGNGKSLELEGDYFFLDCSYVNILMTWGTVLLVIILLLFWYACWKKRKDLYFQYAVAIIAVNCVIAHHLMEIPYNLFILAAVAAGMDMNSEAS